MKTYLVSVIIPTYNASFFIERTLKSVLEQTYKNIEIIISDDHSTDSTVDIIKKIQKKNNKITLIQSNKNSGGPAYPVNLAIDKSQGDIIAFLDQDDEWDLNRLEKIILAYKKNPQINVIGNNIKILDENTGIEYFYKHSNEYFPSNNLVDLIVHDNFFSSFSHLTIKKNTLDKIGLLDENLFLAADHDYWLRIALHEQEIIFISENLTIYHKHLTSSSENGKTLEKDLNDSKVLIKKHELIYIKFPKAYSRRLEHLGDLFVILKNRNTAVNYFEKSIKNNPLKIKLVLKYFLVKFKLK